MQRASGSDAGAFQAQARTGGLAGWVMDRLLFAKGARDRVSRLEMVETLSLGGRRQLILVKCDGESFLVGVGADSVQSIIGVRGNNIEIRESLERRRQ